MKPRLLDLFCGAGGAANGYQEAGFYVVGVDVEPQPNYCGDEFIQADVSEFVGPIFREWAVNGRGFDLIHASPPCQRWATATRDPEAHPDLIGPTRELLVASGVPYVIENVPAAPLRPDLSLCGSMFGLQVQRHRVFELSWMVWGPPYCQHDWDGGRPWTITGKLDGKDWKYDHSWKPSFERGRELMQMPWVELMSELTEAIPPAYTKFIGSEFLALIPVSDGGSET